GSSDACRRQHYSMNRIIRYTLSILLAILLLVLLTACSLGPLSTEQARGGNAAATTGAVIPTSTTTLPIQPKPVPGSSGNGGGNGQTGGTSEQIQAARAVFDQINAARAQASLSALQWSNMLVSSAHKHNLAMMAAN